MNVEKKLAIIILFVSALVSFIADADVFQEKSIVPNISTQYLSILITDEEDDEEYCSLTEDCF